MSTKSTRSGGRPRPASYGEQIVTLRVGEPAHGGACVARDDDGRVVFVRHSLPGELVRAKITRTRSKLAWADAIDVLEPSQDRIDSVWPQAGPGGVGGGELAHVAPHAQRAWKEVVIRTQLRRIGGQHILDTVDTCSGTVVQAAPGDADPDDLLLGRRTRVELVADSNGRLAMHRHHGHDLIALQDMPLAVQTLRDLEVFGSAHSKWQDAWAPGDRVRLVAPTADEPLVVTPRGVRNAAGRLVDRRKLRWAVDVAGTRLSYRVRPQGFWQTHREGASVLANAVLDGAALSGGENIVELFAGAGLFSRALAAASPTPARVLTLEGDEDAVADAAANCADLPAVDTWVGQVDAPAVVELAAEVGSVPDVVVLDPPRAGAGQKVCGAIAEAGARRVVLVSCDPAAGARDLSELVAGGYRIESFKAWDLFPHTHHVETVAVLTR